MKTNQTNELLNAIPLEQNIVNELTDKLEKLTVLMWTTDKPMTDGDKLREAAKICCLLSSHYSICGNTLLYNADESDINMRIGHQRRSKKDSDNL